MSVHSESWRIELTRTRPGDRQILVSVDVDEEIKLQLEESLRHSDGGRFSPIEDFEQRSVTCR